MTIDDIEIEIHEEPSVTTEHEDRSAAPEEVVTKKKRWLWVLAIVAGVVAIAAIAVAASSGNGSDDVTEFATLSTATVQRTDVIATETLSGTLGFGDTDTVAYRTSPLGVTTVTGLASGIVTWVVDEGAVIVPGDVLYEVNTVPVVVLEGDTPQYRAFHSRMSDGADVEQLEQALVDLGFDPDGDIEIDEDFTSATRDAIELLQESVGTDDDGKLELGEVLFGPAATYVSAVLVDVGDQIGPGAGLVTTSQALSGTVTHLVAEGETLSQGDVLLAVDGEPVVLLLGDIPAYRLMEIGTEGEDVRQLQTALEELGFGSVDGFAVDGSFTAATTVAVIAWQQSVGARPDGIVNLGDVVFLAEPIRVGATPIAAGDQLRDGMPILSASSNATNVSVDLSTDDQDLVDVGDDVVVILPDESREPGVVSEIGTVVQANQQGATFFEMSVTLINAEAAPGLDEAPVDVEIVSDRADNVLVVPVTALLALSEGGYAVEVVTEDGSIVLVAVDPGLFADGFVEVSSDLLTEGMEVVVP
jgi:peptidoglycan hydrolase-like protein with peptidoglycan-binding domain